MPALYLYTVVYFANVGKNIKSFTIYRWIGGILTYILLYI
jgi:hypothetical protein